MKAGTGAGTEKAGGHNEFCLSPEERRPEAPAQSSTAVKKKKGSVKAGTGAGTEKAGGHNEFCLSPEERRPETPAQSSTAEAPLHLALSSTATNQPSIITKPLLSAASNSKKAASPSSSHRDYRF